MKKVLFIGNSQIGSLKAGWEEILLTSDIPSIEPYFAGVREQVFFYSKLNDSNFYFREDLSNKLNSPLMFSWDNRNSFIDLSIFDKIIIAAGPSRHYLPLYVDQHSSFFPKLSPTLVEDIVLHGRLSNHSAIDRTAPAVFELMKTLTRKVIYLGAPLPSESIKNKLICSDWRENEILDLQDRIKMACSKINACDNYPTFFSPHQTLCDPLMSFTKHQYMREGLRYNGQINGDPYHANSSYGSHVIRFIADLFVQ